MEFDPDSFQRLAGLCWRYDEDNQYLFTVSFDEEKGRVLFVHGFKAAEYFRCAEIPLPAEGPIWLGVSVRENSGMFRYSLDGKRWNNVRPLLDAAVLSDEYYQEGFTGAFVGLFCCDTVDYSACADFEYLKYTPVRVNG